MKVVVIIYVSIVVLAVTGWIKCIVHLCQCDFKENYKAEILYCGGTFVPPVGAVIGWFNFGK